MAVPTTSTLHHSMATQANRVREQSQHQPRPARVRFSINSTGVGESRLLGARALNFGALMLDQPTFSWGVVSLGALATGELPLCTAVVLRYIQNANNAYTGAEVAFRVESSAYNIKLKFDLTFEASTLRSSVGNGNNSQSSAQPNQFTGSTLPVNVGDL